MEKTSPPLDITTPGSIFSCTQDKGSLLENKSEGRALMLAFFYLKYFTDNCYDPFCWDPHLSGRGRVGVEGSLCFNFCHFAKRLPVCNTSTAFTWLVGVFYKLTITIITFRHVTASYHFTACLFCFQRCAKDQAETDEICLCKNYDSAID